jgi:hypothetical protein
MSDIDLVEREPALVARHTYPTAAMIGDYLRAAAGLVPSGLLLATVPMNPFFAVVIAGLAMLFGTFGARTLVRHGTRIEADEDGLRAVGLWHARIDWAALDRFRLAYYSPRRDRSAGWMQLDLGAGRARLRIDSRLDGFDRLVRQAVVAAAARGLDLNEATAANVAALGIRVPEPGGRR